MEKGNKVDNIRIKFLVKAWVESEVEHLRGKDGFLKKYFRYEHLGKSLIHKIQSSKNDVYNIKSMHSDSTISIAKGDAGGNTYTVTVEKNELCLRKN